jgi:hypothetical protein
MRWTIVLAAVAVLAATACDSTDQDEGNTGSGTHSSDDGSPTAPTDGTSSPPERREAARRGSYDWRMTRPAIDGQIEGYTTRASAPAGTALELKVSTTQKTFKVFAYRIGAYAGGSGRLVWKSEPVAGVRQPGAVFAPHETRTVVAPWRLSLSVGTSTWPAGFYILRLLTASGWETQIPYIVSSTSASGTVALVTPVTTWQAYNLWGGYSLYHGPDGDRRSWAVSFDRPYRGVGGMNDLHTAVVPIVLRAEASGVPLSYFANLDLHSRPDMLKGARGYISMGHDEYWTTMMRSRVLDARDAGTNLAFLGANTMYWRVRLEDRGTGPMRLLTGYRSDAFLDPLRGAKPREATSRFRDAPAARPENELTGMLYECFPVDADYRITTPGWWGFRGTGVQRGTAIPGLVGGESDRVYPDSAMPRPLQILSYASFSCRGDQTSTQSVYYTTPSGAGVFNAGTLRWGCALVDRCDRPLGTQTMAFTRKVTANILRAFAEGPVGIRHPARDNVADFYLPLVNGVSAS